jgi:hypothetical protein
MQPAIRMLLGSLGLIAALALPSYQASATCGERGGPGYRGPNGQCVGWASIGKICGNPPTTNCTAELANPNAGDAAKHGKAIEALRPAGGAAALLAVPPPAGSTQDGDVAQCKTIADNAARLECFDRMTGLKK